MDGFRDELRVLYQAAALGRADIVREMAGSLRARVGTEGKFRSLFLCALL